MEKKQFAKVKYFRENPLASAVSTKLVSGRGGYGSRSAADLESIMPTLHTAQQITQGTTQSMNDIDNIFEVLPDTELAMQILVSSILSPNDMRRPELTWSVDGCELPAPLVGSLIEILRNYFEDDYKIKKELPKWLEHALFLTGSYPIAIIPESSLDDLINERNVSTESIKAQLDANSVPKSLGLLGSQSTSSASKRSMGLESLLNSDPMPASYDSKCRVDENVFITDHFGTLKLPELARKITEKRVHSKITQRLNWSLGVATESLQRTIPEGAARMSLGDIERSFYSNRNVGLKQIAQVKSADQASRATIGHPMAMKLPSDSVIPVHVPSDPQKHIGYFVLLDEFGNPLSNAKQSSYYKEISAMRNAYSGKSANSNTLQHVKTLSAGLGCPDGTSFYEMSQIYGKALERDLLERLKLGIYGDNVELAHVNEIYEVMVARSLSAKRTQLLYIPSALMLYVAFDYNKLGIGRSLLEKSKTLASIRAILLFSNTMAAIKNSTNQRKITIEIDPEDPEPDRTVEVLMTELAKVQSQAFPLATTHPMDIVNGIRNAATNIVVKGNPLMPEVSVDVEDRAGTRVMVDSDLDEQMKNRFLASLGLTPELVDSSTDIEFAAEIINRNLMFTKRLAIAQEETENFIKDFVSKYTDNSGKLKYDLIKAIQEYLAEKDKQVEPVLKEDGEVFPETMLADAKEQGILRERVENFTAEYTVSEMIQHFLDCLQVTLPRPDDTKLDNQIELMNGYAQALDVVIPYYINQETLEQLLGDNGRDFVEPVIQMVRGYFMRDFIAKNNILPELQNLIAKPNIEEEPINILESHIEHANGLAVVIKTLIEKLKAKNNPNDGEEDSDSTEDSFDSTSSDTDSSDSGGDDFGDFDDLSLDDESDPTDDAGDGEDADADATEETTDAEADTETSEEPEGDAADDADETTTP